MNTKALQRVMAWLDNAAHELLRPDDERQSLYDAHCWLRLLLESAERGGPVASGKIDLRYDGMIRTLNLAAGPALVWLKEEKP